MAKNLTRWIRVKIGLGDNQLFFKEYVIDDNAGTLHVLKSKSSSSKRTTTATDLGEASSQINRREEPLSYPKQLTDLLPENELGLIRRYITRAPARDRQGILDYLAERLAAGKVDKPVPFLMSIVNNSRNGLLYLPKAAPSPTTLPGSRDPLATYKLQQLHGEASGLRDLIKGSKNQTLRASLEAQLTEIAEQIK